MAGRRTLVLGLDAIAFYRGPYAPVDPVVHHALASALLPGWKGPAPAPVWWAVWEEGFPLAAVRTMDPGASDADLRLPEQGRDPAYLAALARRVRGALDSTREADRGAVTGASSGATAGAGRWLALRVAQQVLAGRSLHDAARLGGPQLRARHRRRPRRAGAPRQLTDGRRLPRTETGGPGSRALARDVKTWLAGQHPSPTDPEPRREASPGS